jgi:hypothetical protein
MPFLSPSPDSMDHIPRTLHALDLARVDTVSLSIHLTAHRVSHFTRYSKINRPHSTSQLPFSQPQSEQTTVTVQLHLPLPSTTLSPDEIQHLGTIEKMLERCLAPSLYPKVMNLQLNAGKLKSNYLVTNYLTIMMTVKDLQHQRHSEATRADSQASNATKSESGNHPLNDDQAANHECDNSALEVNAPRPIIAVSADDETPEDDWDLYFPDLSMEELEEFDEQMRGLSTAPSTPAIQDTPLDAPASPR